MKIPLVSVIIPTKNRQKYAELTIRQIANMKKNIEIIIQDNSDDISLYEKIEDLVDDKWVKYYYESHPLSMSQNYNSAAEKVTGKYLFAIGDDDGVLPNIIQCAEWMEKNGVDALKPAKDLVYFYPGVLEWPRSSCLKYRKYAGNYFFSNPEAGVISLLDDGGCNYQNKNVVGSYHGLVNMDIMREVKRITGKYYDGLVPDMYSVVCISLLPKIKFATLDYPISLPGVCSSSGSAVGRTISLGKIKVKDSPHLKMEPGFQWSTLTPKYYASETIWAETMLYALQKMNRSDLIDKYYNEWALIYHLFFKYNEHINIIKDNLSMDQKKYMLNLHKNVGKGRWSKVFEYIIERFSGELKVYNRVNNIIEAVRVVTQKLNLKYFSLS